MPCRPMEGIGARWRYLWLSCNVFLLSERDWRQTEKGFFCCCQWCVCVCGSWQCVLRKQQWRTLKKSVCHLLSASVQQGKGGSCQDLFSDDAQTLCCCPLSNHIHHGVEHHSSTGATWCCVTQFTTELRSYWGSSLFIFCWSHLMDISVNVKHQACQERR